MLTLECKTLFYGTDNSRRFIALSPLLKSVSNGRLFKKIYEEISEIPVVDIHTHLNHRKLRANDLSDIILYHYIATELAASGMPREILNVEDPQERIRKCLPFLKNIRNTSTFWALKQILSNLFEFGEDLNDESLSKLQEKFQVFERSFDGAIFLKERLRMDRVFLTLQFADRDTAFDPAFFTGSLRFESLSKDLSHEALKKLEEIALLEIKNHNDFRDGIITVFQRFERIVHSIALSLNPSEIIIDPDETRVDEAIEKIRLGKQLAFDDKIHILSFTVDTFLKLMEGKSITFQLMLGVERPVIGASPPDYAIVVNEPRQLFSLCPLFHKYSEVNFDVISASRMQTHELNVISKNYSNVFVSGFWWYSYYPSLMNERIVERLQMLPMNKWCAFFSDAYVPEWCFGKLQLVKNQMTLALSSLVEQGYLDMETALETARKLLYENAVDIYYLKVKKT
jgi:glucuronate isomerase